MKLFYQYIFFIFSPISNHIHPLQVENCDSNSRLVVDEDDNVKSGLKGLKEAWVTPILIKPSLDPENIKNFRPISNLPFLAKTLEKVVSSQLQDHVKTYSPHDKF